MENVDLNAERSVLGSLLSDQEAYKNHGHNIDLVYFYSDHHRRIFKAIKSLQDSGTPSDLVTVPDKLRQDQDLDYAGGIAYLSELVSEHTTSAHIGYHIEILRTFSIKRQMATKTEQMAKYLASGIDTAEVSKELHSLSMKLKGERVKKPTPSGLKSYDDFATHMQSIKEYRYMENIGFYMWKEEGYWKRHSRDEVESEIMDVQRELRFPVNPSFIGNTRRIMELDCRHEIQNNDSRYINFKNCMIDVDNKCTIDHDYNVFSTYQIPVDFRVKGDLKNISYDINYMMEKGPKWLKYIDEVACGDPEIVRQIRQMIGSCLIADTKYQAAFFLYGKGSNGKSVLTKIIENLVGSQNTSSISFKDLQKTFCRSRLYNRLVNISTEIEFGEAVNGEIFKQVVSGDSIEAEFKNKDSFSFRPFCKLIYCCNMFPRLNERSYAFWRRVHLVPFDATFPEEAQNKNLEIELMGELEAIAYWSVYGLYDLINSGTFIKPQRSIELLAKIQNESSTALQFASEKIDINAEAFIDKLQLYKSYNEYCNESNFRPLAKTRFESEILEHFPHVISTNHRGGWVFKGLTYRSIMSFSPTSDEAKIERMFV